MTTFDMLRQAHERMTARQVFGEPYERDGLTVIPVARVIGGVGGGSGNSEQQDGQGGGFGIIASPAGVYVIKDGQVKWEPAINVNRIVLGGQLIAIVVLLMVHPLIKAWIKRRAS